VGWQQNEKALKPCISTSVFSRSAAQPRPCHLGPIFPRDIFFKSNGVSGGEKTDEIGRLENRVLVPEEAGMLCGLDQTKGYCFRG